MKNNRSATPKVMHLHRLILRLLGEQDIACLLTKGLKIPAGMRIRRQHRQHLPTFDLGQSLFGA